jgi:L-phenylalanine/L-methionine N-acetyltransferase
MEITIRRAEPSDFEALWRIFADESAYSGTLQMPYPSKEVWRERLSKSHQTDYILVAEVDGQVVGDAGLHPNTSTPRRAHTAYIGMVIPAAWQGKGVGTALMKALLDLADNWFGFSRLELHVYTDNKAAIALYEKFGFTREGTHPRYALRQGAYVDSYSMGRIKA